MTFTVTTDRPDLFKIPPTISPLGVLIFTALTAYDTQKLARMAADPQITGQGEALLGKLSIMGALKLYLDFINLFLFLLRLFGRRN